MNYYYYCISFLNRNRRNRAKHERPVGFDEEDVPMSQKKKPKIKPVEEPSPLTEEKFSSEVMEEEVEEEEEVEDDGSDWTKKFNGLWQSQEHDFRLEKAFNLLMSFGGSQCCICSLFVSPSPFQVYQRRKLKTSVKCLAARDKSRRRFGVGGLKVQ